LAMDHFGLVMAGMHPELVTASSELEIAERGWQHRGIIWLPSKMILADETVPQNWQVTSDSLSAWLANKLGAEQLIIVKSKSLTCYSKFEAISLPALLEDELVDSSFGGFIKTQHYQTWLVNKEDCGLFERDFSLQSLKQTGFLIKV